MDIAGDGVSFNLVHCDTQEHCDGTVQPSLWRLLHTMSWKRTGFLEHETNHE